IWTVQAHPPKLAERTRWTVGNAGGGRPVVGVSVVAPARWGIMSGMGTAVATRPAAGGDRRSPRRQALGSTTSTPGRLQLLLTGVLALTVLVGALGAVVAGRADG